MNTCHYLLESCAEEHLDTILTLSGSYTRLELREAVDKIALITRERGFRKGERALLIADNSLFWVAAYLGILKIGGVVVPLAPAIGREDLEHIVQVTNPTAAYVQAKYLSSLSVMTVHMSLVVDGHPPVEPDLQCKSLTTFQDVIALPVSDLDYEVIDPARDLAAIMFTSGSTGRPRGVMVSHRNIVANTESIIDYMQLQGADRVMVVLPFHYCYGTSLLHTHLRVGGSLVLDSRFMFPNKVLQRMVETECTGFAGVPSHYQILLRNSSLKTMTFPNLRYVQQAGGNLPPVFLRELAAALPNAKIFVMYGQTEATARLSYLPPEYLDKKGGSIGRGIKGVRLRVMSETGVPVKPGNVGEIVAEGENVMPGYWCDPESTRDTIRNGCLHTGDLATVDEDGFIYIVDRSKDFLKCGGHRVSCKRVEEMLLQFSDLVEAAVIGTPDEWSGEAVKAFVVGKPGATPDLRSRLATFCAETFPSHLIPREIVVVKELPKNQAGKVDRVGLKSGGVIN